MGWVGPVATVVAVGVLMTGCSADEGAGDRSLGAGAEDVAVSLGHVHALGTDPADGVLYAASHYGVFRLRAGSATRVADRWQDTMGFTVVGPERFIGSGHPDLRETDLPVHLGLISSTDGAKSWESVSLSGEADFHALDAARSGNRIVGFDAVSGRLLVSTDAGKTWRSVARPGGAGLVDLALNPADENAVIATTGQGELRRYSLSGGESREPGELGGAPPLAFVDWPTAKLLIGLAADGVAYSSSDAGGSWVRVGEVPGQAQALDVAPGRWHAASTAGVFESTDEGRTWVNLGESG
jgi:photosystem II stability/assembly factor-like uncharacterized protein